MKKFVSWSGGKDCTLALYKFLQSGGDGVGCLLNMARCNPRSGHRVSDALFHAQAEAMGLPLIREHVSPDNEYIYHFDKAINALKEQGYEAGIFGDLYLESHRVWIDAQCERLGITPIYPLWGIDVHELYRDFVEAGFKSKIIAVQLNEEYRELLGEDLSMEIHQKMLTFGESYDVCGENGEFHTFVHDGPLFSSPLDIEVVGSYEHERLRGIELDIKK